MKLYKHQSEAIKHALNYLKSKNNKSYRLDFGPGNGKTLASIHIAENIQLNDCSVIVACHSKILREQFKEKLKLATDKGLSLKKRLAFLYMAHTSQNEEISV